LSVLEQESGARRLGFGLLPTLTRVPGRARVNLRGVLKLESRLVWRHRSDMGKVRVRLMLTNLSDVHLNRHGFRKAKPRQLDVAASAFSQISTPRPSHFDSATAPLTPNSSSTRHPEPVKFPP
jgi:hypothetical protein